MQINVTWSPEKKTEKEQGIYQREVSLYKSWVKSCCKETR